MQCRAIGTHDLVVRPKTMLTLGKLDDKKASFVERVLDVRRGELCWVVGTVYMEMAGKPNVLDDIEKDVQPPSLHDTCRTF